jgi:hypothetical protein
VTYSDICVTADFCGVPIAVEGIVPLHQWWEGACP